MIIVIPLKSESNNDYLELRYALRSIEKNLEQSNVLIVGSLPTWIKGVDWVKSQDIEGRKQFTLFSKVVNLPYEKFVYLHDDHFCLQPTKIKPWYHKNLSYALGCASGRYWTAVKNTLDHFGDIKNYDIHVPCIFERDKLSKLKSLDWNKEYIVKSSYFNNEDGEEMTDCKINRLMSKEAIKEKIKDRVFFSTGPNGMKQPMIELLNELFPNKSKYEK